MSYQTKNKQRSGFSLIEIMIAVVILSFGAVSLYSSFFSSLDGTVHLNNRALSCTIFSDLMWQANIALRNSDANTFKTQKGERVLGGTKFRYSFDLSEVPKIDGLYSLRILVSWKEGRRDISLSQERLIRKLINASGG